MMRETTCGHSHQRTDGGGGGTNNCSDNTVGTISLDIGQAKQPDNPPNRENSRAKYHVSIGGGDSISTPVIAGTTGTDNGQSKHSQESNQSPLSGPSRSSASTNANVYKVALP